jgi:hypothetical protein
VATLERLHFARSRKGNLWRRYRDLTLTVFQRKDETYAWCIAHGDRPRFSPRSCDTEEDALDDLIETVAVT